MKQQSQNVQSTKIKEMTNIQPKQQDIFIHIYNTQDTMYTNQTGRFPTTLSNKNKYIMMLVEIDGNFIDAEPMKSKTEGAMIKAYHALWERQTAKGTIKQQHT
jgi:hypothetical protein